MATTELPTTRPLAEYGPETVEAVSWHTWERERKGVTVEHSYRLDHASADCPRAVEAAGIGATFLSVEERVAGWPCRECFLDTAARS